jgi:hypothetical protein
MNLNEFLRNFPSRFTAVQTHAPSTPANGRFQFLILPVPTDSRPFGQPPLRFVRNPVTADCAKYQCARRFINQH